MEKLGDNRARLDLAQVGRLELLHGPPDEWGPKCLLPSVGPAPIDAQPMPMFAEGLLSWSSEHLEKDEQFLNLGLKGLEVRRTKPTLPIEQIRPEGSLVLGDAGPQRGDVGFQIPVEGKNPKQGLSGVPKGSIQTGHINVAGDKLGQRDSTALSEWDLREWGRAQSRGASGVDAHLRQFALDDLFRVTEELFWVSVRPRKNAAGPENLRRDSEGRIEPASCPFLGVRADSQLAGEGWRGQREVLIEQVGGK